MDFWPITFAEMRKIPVPRGVEEEGKLPTYPLTASYRNLIPPTFAPQLQPIEIDAAGPFSKGHPMISLQKWESKKERQRFREWRAVAVSIKT